MGKRPAVLSPHFWALIALQLSLACKASIRTQVVDGGAAKSADPASRGPITLRVVDASELPVCTAANEGQLAYVMTQDLFKVCTQSTWVDITIEGPRGEPGTPGDHGAPGTPGETGAPGADAPHLMAKVSNEPAGEQCPNAGIKLEIGFDDGREGTTAKDGQLQAAEILSTKFVCNGRDGINPDLPPLGLGWINDSPAKLRRVTVGWTPSSLLGDVDQIVSVYENKLCSGDPVVEQSGLAHDVDRYELSLPRDAEYWFRVTARSTQTRLPSACSLKSLVVDTVSPPPATALSLGTALFVNTARINASWTPSTASDVKDQIVTFYRDDGCNTMHAVTPALDRRLSQLVQDLDFEFTYTFKVTSCDYAGNCNISSCSTAVTRDVTIPAAPTTVSWDIGATTSAAFARASWSPSLSTDVVNYNLQVYTDSSCLTLVPGSTALVADTSYDVPFASDGNYYFRIYAIDRAGNQSLPSICSAALRVDTEIPANATSLDWRLALSSITQITALWKPSTATDVATQSIRVYSDASCSTGVTPAISNVAATTKEQAFVLPGPGSYYFGVESRDQSGNLSNRSCTPNPVKIDTTQPLNPSQVSFDRAITFDGSLLVQFTPGTDLNLDYHQFKACADNGCSSGCVGHGRGPSGSRITGLIPGRDYYLCVQAVDKVGLNSNWIASTSTAGSWTEPGFKDLAVGQNHNCAIATSGNVYCWGDGSDYQLGSNDTTTLTRPTKIDMSNVSGEKTFVKIVAGDKHTCALTADHRVFCWGHNASGQLGTNSFNPAGLPVQLSTTSITGEKSIRELSAGESHTCAITYEGVLYCWGDNTNGQLGNGSNTNSSIPVAVTTTGIAGSKLFKAVAAGGQHTCALAGDGVVHCWGLGTSGQLGHNATTSSNTPVQAATTNLSGTTSFRMISAGSAHSCAIAANGLGYCWGTNTNGQLGIGSTSPALVPTVLTFSGSDVYLMHLSSGNSHSCAVSGQGAGYCWGLGTSGQLGDSQENSALTPVSLDLTGFATNQDQTWRRVLSGDSHTCGLTTDGTIYCFGANHLAQLGTGTTGSSSSAPQRLDLQLIRELPGFTDLSVGAYVSSSVADTICALTGKSRVYCWGYGNVGILGRDRSVNTNSPVADVIDTSAMAGSRVFRSVAVSHLFACGISGEGMVYCWGDDSNGRLGNGPGVASTKPQPIDISNLPSNTSFIQVELGLAHACALTTDGKAYCWGADNVGALGDGGSIDNDSQVPVALDLSGLSGETKLVAIAAFNYTGYAITGTGKGVGWGNDTSEALGTPSGNSNKPLLLDYTNVIGDQSILRFADSSHAQQACFITVAGVPYCWGLNDNGELSFGNTTRTARPTQMTRTNITGEKAIAIAGIGGYHGCVLTAEGKAYCSGLATRGRLGAGTNATNALSFVPVLTSGMTDTVSTTFIALESAYNGSCALNGEGKAYCWGQNSSYESGNPTLALNVDQTQPGPVLMSDVKMTNGLIAITAGIEHTCGIDDQGKAYCWGYGVDQRLGLGSVTGSQLWPKAIATTAMPAGTRLVDIAAGSKHTCALAEDHEIYCWGIDDVGQLGNTAINQSLATPSPINRSNLSVGEWFSDLYAYNSFTCGRTNLRQSFCWGANTYGNLALENNIHSQTAQLALLTPLSGPKTSIKMTSSTSATHSACVIADGDQSIYCWGLNDKGQLGNGTLVNSYGPVAIDRSPLSPGTQFKLLSSGRWATCAVDKTDTVWCWGTADYPVVGESTSLVPLAIDLSNLPPNSIIQQLVVGDTHACLLTAAGDAYCWGYNLDYRTGTSATSNQNVTKPTIVDTSRVDGVAKFRSLSVGAASTCAITWMGLPYCWGSDGNEKLGDGKSGGTARIPQRVNLTTK